MLLLTSYLKNKTMKTFAKSLFIALTISTVSMADPGRVPAKNHRLATPAHYQMAAYPSVDATYLYVAVDKEIGGRVDVRLKDKKGIALFEQTINRNEDKVRLKLNLADLTDGTYQLEVSNGVETTVRAITIATNEPATAARTIVLL